MSENIHATFTTKSKKRYYTSVILPDGREIPIRFEPVLHNQQDTGSSMYMTGNSQIIAALKKHPYFEERFFLKSETGCDTPAQIQKNTNDNKTKADGSDGGSAGDDNAGPDDGNSGLTQVPGITNKQNALEWLEANKGVKMKVTESVETVKAAALENGVEFTDWK